MIQWLKDKAMRCDDKTRSLSYEGEGEGVSEAKSSNHWSRLC